MACVALSTSARELEGVQVPDQVSVEGKPLALNGAGVRVRVFFKVYIGALYVEHPSKDANALVAADAPKRVQLTALRDIEKARIVDSLRGGFQRNFAAQMPALKPRLDKFLAGIPPLHKGETLTFTYLPSKGTNVSTAEKVWIPGKDFADALLSVWLGANAVDDDLKKSLLGQ